MIVSTTSRDRTAAPSFGGILLTIGRPPRDSRREVEERYADAQDGPGAVATGGGDWKESNAAAQEPTLKRGRSPDDEADNERLVRSFQCSSPPFLKRFVRVLVLVWMMRNTMLNACNTFQLGYRLILYYGIVF